METSKVIQAFLSGGDGCMNDWVEYNKEKNALAFISWHWERLYFALMKNGELYFIPNNLVYDKRESLKDQVLTTFRETRGDIEMKYPTPMYFNKLLDGGEA